MFGAEKNRKSESGSAMSQKSTADLRSATNAERIDEFLGRWKSWIAVGCCCFAVLRVLAFAAAFPLINPVDEASHYGTVYSYAAGKLPGSELPKTEPELARVFALYGSSEYFKTREVLRTFHKDVPMAELPRELQEAQYPKAFKFWSDQSNIEEQSPPVYYLIAASWYRAGKEIGLRDWSIAYWVRFLNAILYGAFVWLAYRFVREVYPERAFLCAGVPLLLAVFPQDVFYGVNFEFSFNTAHWNERRYTSEIRPIIGTHVGRFDFIFNPIVDNSYTGVSNFEFVPATRVAMKVSDIFKVALEEYDDFGRVSHFLPASKQSHQLFSVVDLHTRRLDIEFGLGAGLTNALRHGPVRLFQSWPWPEKA